MAETAPKSAKAAPRLAILLFAVLQSLIFAPAASATVELAQRSLTVSSGSPSAVTSEAFQFAFITPDTLGSISFEYCDSPLFNVPCAAPAGLDVSSANLVSQTQNTGFTIDNADTTANKLVITRAPLANTVSSSTYDFSNITNPSSAGTVFIRIGTYPTTNASGVPDEFGAVAFAVNQPFVVGASVPPFIKFCVAISVAPDCSSLSGDSINLGILSSARASAGQSQFATGTNSPSGYVIYSLGNTMTSGNNTIPRLNAPTTNFPGGGQFGLNLRANTSPAVGQDPVGTGTAAPTANYNIPNRFMFSDGDSIASASISTDYNRMTASYLVNIPANQAPGIYAATITYLAVAQF